jgi:hypothetical protein
MNFEYDNIICLGNNCEVGLQLKRIGYDKSSFFRYTYCGFDCLIKLFENDFKKLFQFESLIPLQGGMIRDGLYDMAFHSDLFELEKLKYNNQADIYEDERSKHLYLVEKLKKQLSNNERNLFFIKSNHNWTTQHLHKLINIIEDFGNLNFSLVVLLSKENSQKKVIIEDERVCFYELSRFAPDEDVLDVRENEYDELFRKLGVLSEKRVSKLEYDPKKPLISLHLPKTAGTAFQQVLSKWFGDSLYFHYTDYYKNTPPIKHDIKDEYGNYLPKVCIHGHFAHNEVFDFYGSDITQFISIIRDPLEAHLSMYFYVKKLGDKAPENHPIKEKLKNPSYNVVQYLEDFKHITYFWFFYPGISLENYKQIIDEKFLFVGTTERIQESVDMLAEKLGFESVEMATDNVSEWNEDVPENSRALFEKNNALAVAVYKYVNDKYFENTLA